MPVCQIRCPGDSPDPLNLLHPLYSLRNHCIFLDSALPDPENGRWSILAAEPTAILTGPNLTPEALENHLEKLLNQESPNLPFVGGFLGFLDYPDDTKAWFSRSAFPLTGWFGLYPEALLWDHREGSLYGVVGSWVEDSCPRLEALCSQTTLLLEQELKTKTTPPTLPPHFWSSNHDLQSFANLVSQAREFIRSGDIYQVNLAQRITLPTSSPPIQLYQHLRAKNPAPYAAYLDAGDRLLLSASPELLLEKDPPGRLRTQPIKGTQPRSADPARDAALRHSLLQDPKELAELLMIVDMERNDLGRVATVGSVEVPRINELKTFTSVHHLVADVTALLRPDVKLATLLRAVFPGGSISGAPKIRACQIIESLEKAPRRAFCGAIGFLSANQHLRFNIAIRTAEFSQNQLTLGVGAGIVWDSDPEKEYYETLHKADGFLKAFSATPDA
ncbi:MAG: anthranilate synthase component I family protein [Puniceicoccaceae bacterium]